MEKKYKIYEQFLNFKLKINTNFVYFSEFIRIVVFILFSSFSSIVTKCYLHPARGNTKDFTSTQFI